MKLHRRKKSAMTLLEIMIVIFLIGLIGSVIGYNVKGSLEEGKAFRTEQGAAQIRDILILEASNGRSLEEVVANPDYYLRRSGICKDYKKLMMDGWGQRYTIRTSRNTILVESSALRKHLDKKNKGNPAPTPEVEEEEEYGP